MKAWNLFFLQLFICVITEYLSSPIKDVKANRRLLAAILGYRKEDVGFINEVIGIHNKYRKIHGCRDLSQCARLRQQAGMYAQDLADQGAREPLNDPKVKFGIGENIYISCGNEVTAEEVVNHWYNEACNYFINKKSYDDYKHFAQVVWKATYLIGVGRRTSTKSGQKCTYVVTRYRPGAEPGPAESVNIPKGNFDSSICSGNSVGTTTNMQVSAGVTPQTGNKVTPGSVTNFGQSIPGKPVPEQKGHQPSESGGFVGSSNAGFPEKGGNSGQNAGESMSTVEKPLSQSKSSQVIVLPDNGQPPKYSAPTGSTGTAINVAGSTEGNSGTAEGNIIPNVTPTSVPGTGDRERAKNPENSHVSPLIEQSETGSKGSLEESGDQQVSHKPSPHCPPCPGSELQTESFETSGGAENLPASNNDPVSTGESQSVDSKPDQPAVSSNPENPLEQSIAGKPDKSAEQVSPVNGNNPANPGKPPDQVNPVNTVNPAEQGKPGDKQANPGKPPEQVNPVNTVNPVEQGKPDDDKLANPTKPGNEKQCPPCSCPKKEGNEKPEAPQGSQGNKPSSGEESKTSPSQERPGEKGGNSVLQGQPSGTEVSQGQPSEGNNVPTNEVKPSNEGNVVSPSPSGQSSGEGGEGNPTVQGVNGGNTGSVGTSGAGGNQPAKEPTEIGSPNSPSEGASVTSGGSEGSTGTTGASSGGKEGTQGVTDRENQSQSAGKTEGTGTTQGEGSRTSPGETGSSGTGDGGQAGGTQGTNGQEGGQSGSKPEGGAFVESLGVFQQSALEAHNKYRQLHNSPPLANNREMSTQATEFAKTLAKSGIADAEHSLKSSRENQGENVYAGCATDPSGADVTKEWYKELCNYNYNKNARIDEKKPIGHFTQVVWKSSTEFGIGRAYSADQNCVYIVARYKPAGNIIGSEASNIARSTMDGEYCGREFMAFNKPENGQMKEGMSSEGQSNSVSEVGSELPNQTTNEGNQHESGNAGGEGNQQNTNTGGTEANTGAASNVGEGNQQNTNTGKSNRPETISNSSEGNQQETSTNVNNEQAQTNPSGEGYRNKRIKTPFLPGYLQKSVAENTNKRYRGLRTE